MEPISRSQPRNLIFPGCSHTPLSLSISLSISNNIVSKFHKISHSPIATRRGMGTPSRSVGHLHGQHVKNINSQIWWPHHPRECDRGCGRPYSTLTPPQTLEAHWWKPHIEIRELSSIRTDRQTRHSYKGVSPFNNEKCAWFTTKLDIYWLEGLCMHNLRPPTCRFDVLWLPRNYTKLGYK